YLETKATTIYNYVKGSQTNGASATNRAFSPKGAIIYQPLESMSFYVSYANSFTTNTGVDIYNNPIKPSIIDDYELGWKQLFFHGRAAANLSIYRIRNSNLAQTALVLADGTANTNTNIKELTGETTSDGFDVDFSGTLSKNLYFMTGYGYNNARYTNSSGAKGAIVEGEKLNNNPMHTANATIFYTFTKTAVRGLKLGASGFYTGKRFGGNQNSVGQTPAYNRQVALSGYTTIDVSAGYGFRKFNVLVKLSNITNTLNYLVHDRYSVNPIPPRQLIATVSYKF
ncbi:MAG: TonB-dependent receptor, partial [Bacteroidetes bacterium]|nr:TonB-dependent receptor [Bacteroidota bacterium]